MGFVMSIGSIGSSALAPLFALRVRSFPNDSSSDAAQPTEQSPSGLADFSGLTVQESHLALQIRSRSEFRTASDGTISERSSTRLRFHYDLTTADGQHIELNVKAKVQQASIQDGAGNSLSKTQVKLQFSLLQEGVADGLSPLQSDQVPGETRSGVSDGLQAFLNAVGDALQQFVEGDNATADDLIKKTVDTFNTLVDALSNLLFPAAGTASPPALPTSGEPLGQIPAIDPPPPSDSEPSPAEPVAANEPPKPETPPAAIGNHANTGEPAISADPVPVAPALTEQDVPVAQPASAGNVAPPEDPSAATSPTQLATQVLQSVRLRFMQSLTQIIRTLSPDEQSGNSSTATSQRLDYQSSLSLRIHTASLVDVNA